MFVIIVLINSYAFRIFVLFMFQAPLFRFQLTTQAWLLLTKGGDSMEQVILILVLMYLLKHEDSK